MFTYSRRLPRPRQPTRFWRLFLVLTLVLTGCAAPAPTPTRPAPTSAPTQPTLPAPTPTAPAPTSTPLPSPTPTPQPVSFETRYAYDAAGNLVVRTAPNGATTRYEYDAENRPTRILYADGSAVSYAYDVMGRRTRMTDPLGTTAYTYDLHGRLAEVADPRGNKVQYKYDDAGNLVELTYPDGSAVRYAYNADGLLTQVTDSTGATTYTYDQAGRLTDRKLPNGVVTHYTYDEASRLAGITHADPAGQTLVAFAYTLDAADRCTQVVEINADRQRLTTRYAYDSLGRLIEVTYPDGRTVRYIYDSLGNRLAMETPEGKTTYTYDLANRLLALTEPNGNTTTFIYDANGNLIERRSPAETVRYTYDHENHPVRVQKGATVVEFVYDGDGNRVAKIVDGVRADYVNDVNSLLSQVLLEQGKDRKTRYTLGDRLLAQADATTGEILYPLEDRLGSVVALSGKDDVLAGTIAYDAFGALRPAGDMIGPYGFTGERYDEEVGLLYLRSRYYDPELGRFISRDPFSGFLTEPQSQNGYAYAINSPTNLVDPTGLYPPYPYDQGRYDRMPVYRGEWRRPNELGYTRISPSPTLYMRQAGDRLLDFSVSQLYARALGLLPSSYGGMVSAMRNPDHPWLNYFKTVLKGETLEMIFAASPALQEIYGAYKVGALIVGLLLAVYGPDEPDPMALRVYGYAPGIGALAPGLAVELVHGSRPVSREDVEFARGLIYEHAAFYGPRAFSDEQIGHLLGGYTGVGSSAGNAVGGVSLDKAAQVLISLTDITGATYDPATGQVILTGQKNLALPPMNLDDLVVAIRAVYAGEDPGVTMVPVDPSWNDPTQNVKYFGQTENTRFGLVMFEADRYLKSLSAGKDSLTGQQVKPDVPGFKPEIQLAFEQRTPVPWHRNWFLPGEVVVKQAADGKSMIFERATMRVESRFIRFLPNDEVEDIPGSSPVTDQFTQFLTAHYDEFAREKTELTELIQLAKIVGVVRWLRDNNVPVDLSWLADYQVAKVETPRTTPGVSNPMCTADGNYCIVSRGGVGYDTENTYRKDDGKVAALREQVLASRPASFPLTWEFTQDGQTYTAVALSLAPAPVVGGYATAVRDLQVPVNGGLLVDFTRYYNSLNLKAGPLGPGWSLTPYALHVQKVLMPTGKIVDGKKMYSAEQSAVLLTGNSSEPLTGPYTRGDQRLFLPERRSDIYRDILIRDDGTYTLRRRDGGVVRFDAQGRLLAVEDNNGNRYTYGYDGQGRLVAVADSTGRGVMLSYDDTGHLTKVAASDGRMVSYGYDARGRLSDVRDTIGLLASYVYDADDRLVELQGGNGQTLLKNRYDGLGRLLAQTDGAGQTVTTAYPVTAGPVSYTDPAGSRWIRQYENGRLTQATDPLGNTISYTYDKAGNPTGITDERGSTTTFSYSEFGNLTQIQSPAGAITRISYDAEARPAWVVKPDNTMTKFEYDGRGNPVTMIGGLQVLSLAADGSVTYDRSQAYTVTLSYDGKGYPVALVDARGNTTRMTYDAQGNPTSVQAFGGVTRLEYDTRSRLATVTDPLGARLSFGYDDRDRVVSLAAGAGMVRYEYDQLGNPVNVVDPLGHATRYEYDTLGRLTSVIEPTGAVTRYEYDAAGNLTRILYPNGAQQRYEYDVRGRLVSEVYTGGL